MKVIDLLNKIAKGEIIKKFVYYGGLYEYDEQSKKYLYGDMWFDLDFEILNDEVEIIEEYNKIKKNIQVCEIIPATKELSTRDNFNLINQNIDKLHKYICDISIKQNEIIDKVNKLGCDNNDK